MGSWFTRFAKATAHTSGRPVTFLVALGVIIVWAVTGPMFNYSNTWQLIINTGTTIVTFLMVFLIQNTQNRDSQAIHVKLDELTDEELDRLHETYVDLAKHAEHRRHGRSQKDDDTASPEKPKTANAKNGQKVAVKNGTSKS